MGNGQPVEFGVADKALAGAFRTGAGLRRDDDTAIPANRRVHGYEVAHFA